MVKIRTRKYAYKYSQDDGEGGGGKEEEEEERKWDISVGWNEILTNFLYTKSCIVVAWRAKKEERSRRERRRGLAVTVLTPFLEQAHSLAPAIWPPQIASATGAVTAVLRPVVAVSTPWYAGPPKQVDQRGTSTRD